MKLKLLLLTSLLTVPYALAEEDTAKKTSQQAELTLTYGNIKELIENLQVQQPQKDKAVEKAPIPSVIRSADYQVKQISKNTAELIANYEVSTFTDDWTELALSAADISIQEILPESTVITSSEGILFLMVKQQGEHKFTIKSLISSSPDGSFHLDFPESVSNRLQLEGFPNYHVQGATRLDTGGYITPINTSRVRMIPKTSTATAKSSWSANTEVLYLADPDELHAEARIQLTAKAEDSANIASLTLPKDSLIHSVTGPDLASWKPSEDGSSAQNITLRWNTQGISRRRITLHYSLPLPGTDETWSLNMPLLGKEQPNKGQIAIITPAHLQLIPERATSAIDPSLAPEWMKQELLPVIVKVTDNKNSNFNCKRLAQLQTATAVISRATFKTQIVADGSTLSTGEIHIQHSNPEPYLIQLPKGSEILTCEINDKLTSPILKEDGSMQLQLKKRSVKDQQTSKVSLSFTSKLDEIAPIEGKLSLTLPSTPLFIHELQWFISLPPNYGASAIEGNLEFGPKSSQPNTISLIKNLSRNQAATTDLFYRKNNS